MLNIFVTRALAFAFIVCSCGCSEAGQNGAPPNSTNHVSSHSRYGWKAEDFFRDPQVVALCQAIEADDLEEIDRLVAKGADVNAKGEGNMTPLLWAFPDNKLNRFQRLLEHGADSNVIVDSVFNSKGSIRPGHSVTHLSAWTKFPGYFEQVMKHGADVDLLDTHTNDSLLHVIIQANVPDKKERLKLVLDQRPQLDRISNFNVTPTMLAVSWAGQYEIALMLLDAGADPDVYVSLQKLVHFVVREERKNRRWEAKAKADYQSLVQRLTDHGESLDDARKDLDRWQEWGKIYPPEKIKELREREIAERQTRKQAESKKKDADSE